MYLIYLKILLFIGPVMFASSVYGTEQKPDQNETEVLTKAHLDLAYQALFISRTSRAYNEIIPNLVRRAKTQLIQKYPNLTDDITRAVDNVAIKLAERQGELDLAISRRWAERFSERELKEISAFYATPTGTKLAKQNTELIAVGLEEARKWGAIIGRDLILDVRKKLKAFGHEL